MILGLYESNTTLIGCHLCTTDIAVNETMQISLVPSIDWDAFTYLVNLNNLILAALE